MIDYKKTIRLPQTGFPMRANLAQREPEVLKRWSEDKVYHSRLAQLEGEAERFVFHDGPPYANGHLHYGTVFNKILKDIVIKYQCLAQRRVRFVPGWDCHGLPIELNVERAMGREKARHIPAVSLRKACRKEAEKWIDVQRKEFQRLGVFALWDAPYLTMHPKYERGILQVLAACADQGIIERGKKPVYWCGQCQTALAEAEVEYADHTSPSIYVKFPVVDQHADALRALGGIDAADATPLFALIWTTTPWTLPANLAIAVHPDFEYRLVDVGGERWLVAADRIEAVAQATGTSPKPIGRAMTGESLTSLKAMHPFEERAAPLLMADYVTLDAGTGLVHTAPGHGIDDFKLGQAHQLETFTPVDEEAKFTDAVPAPWRGRSVMEANPEIVHFLASRSRLANPEGQTVRHSYPHCWRCKSPVIFRATTQWFILLDKPLQRDAQGRSLRQVAMQSITEVSWVPVWGRDRIEGMVSQRPDWCISRQRRWGVPIPAFHCQTCSKPLLNSTTILHIAELFGEHGADAWFERSAGELLPTDYRCPHCQGQQWVKDDSILDVWFESGASFHAVLKSDAYGLQDSIPADLYLEGSDQHRGWFHSALLLGAAMFGHAPYKRVLTHGFVCDDQGRPYSKSEIRRRQEAGEKIEYIEPEVVIKQKGAELLRAWTASQDYRSDPRYSEDHLTQVSESYFKLRNTLRFVLGNLHDYQSQSVGNDDLLDAWAQARMRQYMHEVMDAYEAYDFRRVFQITLELSVGDWSAFYLDVVKDRLYCDHADSARRRSTQKTLDMIARGMLAALAPILCFTADEAWGYLPGEAGQSVFVRGHLVRPTGRERDQVLLGAGSVLFRVRDAINVTMEPLVREKVLSHRREAAVTLSLPDDQARAIAQVSDNLAETLAVAEVNVSLADTLQVAVRKTEHARCARCWRHQPDVGQSEQELCGRCAEVMKTWQKS